MARAKTKKKAASRISKRAEGRIVGVSLENPDFGARRLVSLLKQEKISASPSQIYGVLKRHDLQTRDKRFAKLETQSPKRAKAESGKPSVTRSLPPSSARFEATTGPV